MFSRMSCCSDRSRRILSTRPEALRKLESRTAILFRSSGYSGDAEHGLKRRSGTQPCAYARLGLRQLSANAHWPTISIAVCIRNEFRNFRMRTCDPEGVQCRPISRYCSVFESPVVALPTSMQSLFRGVGSFVT